MKNLLLFTCVLIHLMCSAIPLCAEEEKKENSNSYVSFCILSLQKEVHWLLKNTDDKKLSREAEKVIIEKIESTLNQIKKIATNPDCKNLTFIKVKNGMLQAEAVTRFEGQMENASGALLGFADELNNDSTVKDKIEAMNKRLDVAHATLLDASK